MADLWVPILTAAMARLAATKPPTAPAAELGAGTQPAFPSVRAYLIDDRVQRGPGGPRSPVNLRTLGLDVECRAAGDSVVSVYASLAVLVDWVRCLDGQVLGEAVEECVEADTTFSFAAEDRPAALATVHFTMRYRQKVGDTSRAG